MPPAYESPVIRNGDFKEGQTYRIKKEHALRPDEDNLVVLHRYYDQDGSEWSTKDGDFIAEEALEPVDTDILGALKKVRQYKAELREDIDELVEQMTTLQNTEENLLELL